MREGLRYTTERPKIKDWFKIAGIGQCPKRATGFPWGVDVEGGVLGLCETLATFEIRVRQGVGLASSQSGPLSLVEIKWLRNGSVFQLKQGVMCQLVKEDQQRKQKRFISRYNINHLFLLSHFPKCLFF